VSQRLIGQMASGWTTREEDGFVLHLDTPGDAHLAFAASVATGLSARPRRLQPRFLYDAVGSELYEQITELDEYYPMRTEDAILARFAADIAAAAGASTLVELGSGSSTKTRHLIEAWQAHGPVAYVPIDVSPAALEGAGADLRQRYPDLHVEGVAATFERALPVVADLHPKTLLFLGSTLGNFEPDEVQSFLREVATSLAPGDCFVMGIDLDKDPAVLEPAYADSKGITEQFIVNVFTRMNRELGSGFDADAFSLNSYYDTERRRIEMWARVHRSQRVHVAPLHRSFSIAGGERILVEVSRKFQVDHIAAEAARFDLQLEQTFTDERGWFAVLLLRRMYGPGGRLERGTHSPRRPESAPVDQWRWVPSEPSWELGAAPVTCAQWQAFCKAGGYQDAGLWTEQGWAWRIANGVTAPLEWDHDEQGRVFVRGANLDHLEPVAGVSYHEAVAFAAFSKARLPTDGEWTRAAGWDPEHGRDRRWPWGDSPPDPRRVNAGGGLSTPMAVGSYPDSGSFFGHQQLLGDVWEWVVGADAPMLAGGAFDTPLSALSCSLRREADPGLRDATVGLRLARG